MVSYTYVKAGEAKARYNVELHVEIYFTAMPQCFVKPGERSGAVYMKLNVVLGLVVGLDNEIRS